MSDLAARVAHLEAALATLLGAQYRRSAVAEAEGEEDPIVAEARGLTPAAQGLFVLTRTAEAAGLPFSEMRGKLKVPWIVAVRDDAIWRLHMLGWSSVKIGHFLFRHHTTVLDALARREKRMSVVSD